MNGAAGDFLRRSADLLERGDRSGALALIAEALADLGEVPGNGPQANPPGDLAALPPDVADAARELYRAAFPLVIRAAFPSLELLPEHAERLREQLPAVLRRSGSLGRVPDWRAEARDVAALALEAAEGTPALWKVGRHAEQLRKLADAEGET